MRARKLDYMMVTALKRKFKLGYLRSSNLFEELADAGIVEGYDKITIDHPPRIFKDTLKKFKIPKSLV